MKKIINYSGISALILIAALVFIPVSCSKEPVKDNPDADNSSQLIKISGEDANAGTKTILVNLSTLWLGGSDKVGVYCAESTGGNVNTPYTAQSTAFTSAFTGAMKWGTGTHNFYAYYPYLAGSAVATVVPITLTAAQTQSAGNSSSHLSALDFMVANRMLNVSQGTTGDPTSVDLRYNHVFSILEFQIVGTGTLKAVKLVVPTNPIAFSGGTIDITLATPATGISYPIAGQTGTTKEVVVTLTNAATLSTTTATTVYMVVNPGAQTGNCTIGLSSDGTNYLTISKPAPVTDGGFLRGKKYVVSIDAEPYGGVFGTVTIGTQTWMASNLKATKYNDGTDIPYVTDNSLWEDLVSGAYCWFDVNNGYPSPSYVYTYGPLYNWYAVNTGKLCPTGWSVPTDAQWTTLTDYLTTNHYGYTQPDGTDIAKSMASTSGWASNGTAGNVGNDQASNNASGFTALPGGYRLYTGNSINNGYNGYWWSSTASSGTSGSLRYIAYNNSLVRSNGYYKASGLSVRCLKDAAP